MRIPHKGDLALEVVQTAHTILEGFRIFLARAASEMERLQAVARAA